MTRHDLKEQLKHDQFSESVSGAIEYASSNRRRVIQWLVVAVVAALLIGGAIWFNSYRRAQREKDLQAAFNVIETPVGPHNDYSKTFATEDEKRTASMRALNDVMAKDRGTREGYMAQYYLGTLKAQNNDSAGAEKDLRAVANSSSDAAALAKIALAQLYISTKRTSEAQQLLRSLIDKPTDLVSKAQAQILLAQMLQSTDPQESKRLLKAVKTPTESMAVSRAADQVAGQISK